MAFTVIFMDAGQGDATLLEYPDGSLVLVDCGSKKNWSVAHDQIAMIFQRLIYDNGNRLKALVLTHPDGDHYNLIDALIRQQQVDVDAIFIGGEIEDYDDIADARRHPVRGRRDLLLVAGGSAGAHP